MKNRHHSTREQLAAFKDAIDYEHFGCFYDPPKEEGYIEDFNDYN